MFFFVVCGRIMLLNYMEQFEPLHWIFWAFAPLTRVCILCTCAFISSWVHASCVIVWSQLDTQSDVKISSHVLRFPVFSSKFSLKEKKVHLFSFRVTSYTKSYDFSRSCYFLPGRKELDWAYLGMARMRTVYSLLPLLHCFSFLNCTTP